MKNRNNRVMTIAALLVAVVGLSVGFAALSTNLTINGSGTVKASNWDVHFANLAKVSLTGDAAEVTAPTLTATKVGDYSVNLKGPGDSVEYTFDIVNSGSYDAKIGSITIPTPECSSKPADYAGDIANYCISILEYSLTYATSGQTVAVDDTLNVGETKKVKVKLLFREKAGAELLPSDDVTISNLSIPITYVQV